MKYKHILTDFFFEDTEHFINEDILEDINCVIPMCRIRNYIQDILSIPYEEYLCYLISWKLPEIDSDCLTQSSSFAAAEIEMCRALIEFENLGYTFSEIGQMFPQYCTTKTHAAIQKYGENQVKTAKQLGLTYLYFGKWYLNCIGYVYEELSENDRKRLLARTLLRDPLYGCMVRDLIDHDISLDSYMLNLSKSTIIRRASGILRILNIVQEVSQDEGFPLHNCKFTRPQKSNVEVIPKDDYMFLFRKSANKSFLNRGMTLLKSIHSLIPNVIGIDIPKGGALEVKIILNGEDFSARLNHVGFSDSDSDCYQIFWSRSSGLHLVLNQLAEKYGGYFEFSVFGLCPKKTFIIKPHLENLLENK